MKSELYEQLSHATDVESFRKGLVSFAHELDFGLVVGLMTIAHRGAPMEYISVGNAPKEFEDIQKDNQLAISDPVHQRLAKMSSPITYDQSFYVEAGAGELWEMVAPFGYKTGAVVAAHIPGGRRLYLGVDRDAPLPKDPVKLNRMLADLQLLAIHAQDAAARVLVSRIPPKASIPQRQLDILKLSMEGKSSWAVGCLLGISENTVNYHIKQLFKELGVSTKQQAIVKALELGLV